MKKYYTIVLAKKPPMADEEDWPTPDNTLQTITVDCALDLYYVMNRYIEDAPAPWWWIFDGDIDEDNLMLSGAIDPDDVEIIEDEVLS
jgi:hypothetical protein